MLYLSLVLHTLALAPAPRQRKSELLSRKETELLGIVWRGNASAPSTHENLPELKDYPAAFSWGDVNGTNFLTPSLNQHIPQYCGSCWAHGSISALGDRIKIARGAKGTDVQLSVQHMLNCGGIGSCYGGSVEGPYQWIHKISATGSGISYATSQPYVACSSDSKGGLCVGHDWTCSALNTARTCPTFGEDCVGLSHYPNATVADYGHVSGAKAIMKEVYARGPVACGIDANPLVKYQTGIAKGFSLSTDHVVSIVGWGTDASDGQYWIVRNSWGEYWGEQGFVRVKFGALALERSCAWAVPGSYTVPEKANQFHCFEDGSNCASTVDAA